MPEIWSIKQSVFICIVPTHNKSNLMTFPRSVVDTWLREYHDFYDEQYISWYPTCDFFNVSLKGGSYQVAKWERPFYSLVHHLRQTQVVLKSYFNCPISTLINLQKSVLV